MQQLQQYSPNAFLSQGLYILFSLLEPVWFNNSLALQCLFPLSPMSCSILNQGLSQQSFFSHCHRHSHRWRLSGDTQFHMTIGRVLKRFNLCTHAVMMPLSQVTIGRTSKPLDPRLFAVTMMLSQVTISRTSKPFNPRVPIFPLIIVQPLLVG